MTGNNKKYTFCTNGSKAVVDSSKKHCFCMVTQPDLNALTWPDAWHYCELANPPYPVLTRLVADPLKKNELEELTKGERVCQVYVP